jgi:hypothetical protein
MLPLLAQSGARRIAKRCLSSLRSPLLAAGGPTPEQAACNGATGGRGASAALAPRGRASSSAAGLLIDAVTKEPLSELEIEGGGRTAARRAAAGARLLSSCLACRAAAPPDS